jgi:hypothetical protein
MTYQLVIGIVLVLIVLVSAILGLGGIWGWFSGDYSWQVFLTFLVCGGAVIGVSYVAHIFLGVG